MGWFGQWQGGGNGMIDSFSEALQAVKGGYAGIPELVKRTVNGLQRISCSRFHGIKLGVVSPQT